MVDNAAAAEPLIAPTDERDYDYDYNGRSEDEEREREGENEETDVDAEERALVSPGRFIWILTFCAGVSGLLVGYEYATYT